MKWLVLIFILLLIISGCVMDTRQDIPVDDKTSTSTRDYHFRGSAHNLSGFPEKDPVRRAYPAITESASPHDEVATRIPDTDSSTSHRINGLRLSGLEPDMNEPVSRKSLEGYMGNGEFISMITLSRERYFSFRLDNDIFDNTDRYYTHGLYFALVSPFLASFPLNRLLAPYWGSGINYYGITLVQNIYTPLRTKSGGILAGDRPYASYLYLSTFKITNDNIKKTRFSGELQMGIIGPSSLGEFVQKAFHNSAFCNCVEAVGWEYQIRDDLVLNYLVEIEKGFLLNPYVEINGRVSGILGTLYTNINAGFFLRTGIFNPYFTLLEFSKRSINRTRGFKNTQIYFFLNTGGKLIGYDATLEGGLLNNTNPYTIPARELSRAILKGSAGLVFSYGGIQIKAEQFLQSPEFKKGLWHRWLSIGISFSF